MHMTIQFRHLAVTALFGAALIPASSAMAQDGDGVLEVGQVAPDFEIIGSTNTGVLEAPIRLRDFRGKTVVIAFFYRVRTPG